MIVTGSDIGNEGAKNIERRAHADRLLDLHVGFDLIHRHVSGAFNHYLDILFPSALCKLAEFYKFFYLTYVACIGKAARTARIAK